MDKIKLTHVVNAGLLIEGNDTKILIDGIHNEKMPEWSTVDKALMDYIIYGKDKFKDIDYLLFTHRHGDHFNLEKTLEYIKNNKVKKLVAAKINNTYINSDKLEELNTDYYEVYIINSSDIIIRCIKTKHLSHEKFGIEHYVFIININNKNILYLGDADYTKLELINVLKSFDIDVIVAPFIITASTPGRNFVKKIAPELLILNHLPCKEDDEYNYRNMAEKSIAQHSDEMPETIIFQDLYDELIID